MVCASANVCESKYECVGTERVSVGECEHVCGITICGRVWWVCMSV